MRISRGRGGIEVGRLRHTSERPHLDLQLVALVFSLENRTKAELSDSDRKVWKWQGLECVRSGWAAGSVSTGEERAGCPECQLGF